MSGPPLPSLILSQTENATMVVLRLAQSGAVTAAGKPGM